MSDRALRGALIGYGFIGERGHAAAYASMGEHAPLRITALADICPARREKARAALPGVKVYETHAELLAKEANNLDFVDVCTPPCDHATIAHAALDKGLHVLCEKPLTTSVTEARELLAHAKRAKRVIFPATTTSTRP